MCNHLNLKILIHIFIIIYLIMIIIIMKGENFVAHLDGLGSIPVAHHCTKGYFTPSETVIFEISLILEDNITECQHLVHLLYMIPDTSFFKVVG
jgi:hypothetical protein